MKKQLAFGLSPLAILIVIVVFMLSGCTSDASQEDYSSPKQFKTVYVDGTRCILWVSAGNSHSALQCDFGSK